jgi:hypothetical protein
MMTNIELTNLLPEAESNDYRTRYYLRVATVALYALVILILMHALLLVPTYLYFAEDMRQKQSSFEQLSERLELMKDEESVARIAYIEEEARRLLSHNGSTKVLPALHGILSTPRPGVVLDGFSVTPYDVEDERIVVTGVADSREALQAFRQSLLKNSNAKTVELPIGAFAKESEIPFELIVVGDYPPL